MQEIDHAIYLVLAIALTIWVAQTLYRNGGIFIVDAFHGDKTMAAAVNHLLRVGFYLINLGFIALYLSAGFKPTTLVGSVEYVSAKLGVVMLVLGAMHFFNMFNFSKMRRKARQAEQMQRPLPQYPMQPQPYPPQPSPQAQSPAP